MLSQNILRLNEAIFLLLLTFPSLKEYIYSANMSLERLIEDYPSIPRGERYPSEVKNAVRDAHIIVDENMIPSQLGLRYPRERMLIIFSTADRILRNKIQNPRVPLREIFSAEQYRGRLMLAKSELAHESSGFVAREYVTDEDKRVAKNIELAVNDLFARSQQYNHRMLDETITLDEEIKKPWREFWRDRVK